MALKSILDTINDVKKTTPVKQTVSTNASAKGTVKSGTPATGTASKRGSNTTTNTTDPTLIRATGSGTAQPTTSANRTGTSVSSNRNSSAKDVVNELNDMKSNSSSNNKTPSTGGTTSSTTTKSSTTTSTSNRNELLEYLKEQNEKARQSAIDAIDQSIASQESQYNAQKDNLEDQYQALRNQSEVERYKSRRAIREAQANRGQLDSGYGRQEALLSDINYGNAVNSINMQEAKSINDIQNLIAELKAQGAISKAQTNNEYNSAIQKLIAELQDSK